MFFVICWSRIIKYSGRLKPPRIKIAGRWSPANASTKNCDFGSHHFFRHAHMLPFHHLIFIIPLQHPKTSPIFHTCFFCHPRKFKTHFFWGKGWWNIRFWKHTLEIDAKSFDFPNFFGQLGFGALFPSQHPEISPAKLNSVEPELKILLHGKAQWWGLAAGVISVNRCEGYPGFIWAVRRSANSLFFGVLEMWWSHPVQK